MQITEARARQIAMHQVPNGVIKDVDLERENGVVVWEVEIDGPGKGHEEILIDPRTLEQCCSRRISTDAV